MSSPTAAALAGARQLLAPAIGDGRSLAPLGHAGADAALRGGLMRGALHEVYARDGAGFGFALALARRAAGTRRLLWIVQDYSALEHAQVSATGLAEFGIDPGRLLLFRAANATDALRAGADALSCPALGAAIIEIPGHPKVLDLTASRRLVLGAQTKGVTALVLRTEAEAEPSAAQTRWFVTSAASPKGDDWGHPRFDAELVRNRSGEIGHWMMEWCCDDGAFVEPEARAAIEPRGYAAHPGAVAAQASDRPADPPRQIHRRAG
jgi:protein ImuA